MRRTRLVAAFVAILSFAVPAAARADTNTGELLQVAGSSIVRLDVASGAVKHILAAPGRTITSAAWSPDGAQVAFTDDRCDYGSSCISAEWRIRVLRLADGRVRTIKTVNALWVDEVTWAPRGGHIAFRAFRAFTPTLPPVIVDEVHVVHERERSHRLLGSGYGLAWHPSGKRIAYRTLSGSLLSSDLRGVPSRAAPLEYHGSWPTWSRDGRFLAFVGGRGLLAGGGLYVVTRDSRPRLLGSSGADKPAWSPDSRSLAISVGRGVEIVDVATGNTRALGFEGYSPAWSPSGKLVATTKNGWIRVSDVQAGRDVVTVHTGSAEPVHWRPNV